MLGTFPPREQTRGNAVFVQRGRPGMVVVGRNQQQSREGAVQGMEAGGGMS